MLWSLSPGNMIIKRWRLDVTLMTLGCTRIGTRYAHGRSRNYKVYFALVRMVAIEADSGLRLRESLCYGRGNEVK